MICVIICGCRFRSQPGAFPSQPYERIFGCFSRLDMWLELRKPALASVCILAAAVHGVAVEAQEVESWQKRGEPEAAVSAVPLAGSAGSNLVADASGSDPMLAWGGVVELSPLVITATRSEHTVENAPATVTVVSAEEIQAKGANNLAEALRGVPGLTLSGRQVGGRKTFTIRGAEDRHTLILIDGRRISSTDDTIGHSDYQYGWVAMDQIERIEVVRGPMSALYGSEAVGGVINIITKAGSKDWQGNVRVKGLAGEGAGGDGHVTSASVRGGVGEWLDLSMGVEDARISPTKREDNHRLTDIEGSDRVSGNVQLGFTPLEGQRLQLDVLQSDETRDRNEQYAYGPAKPYYLDSYELTRKQHSLAWKGDWSLLKSELRYSESEFNVDNERSNNITPTRSQSLNDQVLDGNLAFDAGAANRLTLGAEARKESLKNAGLIGGEDDVKHQAVYAQDEITLAESLALTLGARLDDHEIFGKETSPRAYLVWQATPEVIIKGGYGEAFRAPTLKQISPNYVGAEGPHTFYGNPDIKPETSRSGELSVHWQGDKSAYGATVFRNEIKDLIYYNLQKQEGPRRYYIYDNISRAQIDGVEASAQQALGAGFALVANLTWLDAQDADTHEELTGRPEWSANTRLEWQQERVKAALEWQYTGHQMLKNTASQLEEVPAYSLVNLNAQYRWNDQLSFRAGIDNLADLQLEDKSTLFGYVEARRTAWVGTEVSF
ncbi:addiction module killer protein [gamma proteobacterium HdN1]|nr:addiction module killer protein [gamma proteobacterium HdN1]